MLDKLLFIIALCFGLVAFGETVKDSSSVNWKNAEGYINVEKNGKTEHYIVVSSDNQVELVPINEDPAKTLRSKMDIFPGIKNGGK